MLLVVETTLITLIVSGFNYYQPREWPTHFSLFFFKKELSIKLQMEKWENEK